MTVAVCPGSDLMDRCCGGDPGTGSDDLHRRRFSQERDKKLDL